MMVLKSSKYYKEKTLATASPAVNLAKDIYVISIIKYLCSSQTFNIFTALTPCKAENNYISI